MLKSDASCLHTDMFCWWSVDVTCWSKNYCWEASNTPDFSQWWVNLNLLFKHWCGCYSASWHPQLDLLDLSVVGLCLLVRPVFLCSAMCHVQTLAWGLICNYVFFKLISLLCRACCLLKNELCLETSVKFVTKAFWLEVFVDNILRHNN